MFGSLQDKVVLITGAASGIGAQTARLLARRGARLALCDIDTAGLEAIAAELGSARALVRRADVGSLEQMQEAVRAALGRFGGIDCVVANAGIASYGSVLAVDPETFRRVIEVNLIGVFHTVRASLPALIERRGYILVVSSLAAFAPAPGMVAYGASKAGVEQLAHALRLEVAQLGVGVGCAHMSWIDTPMVRDAQADLQSFGESLASLPRPLRKVTSVDACARAFVRAIERRRRRVYVPGWVALLGWAKPLLSSGLAERQALARAPGAIDLMDEEVARLGRSTSARNTATRASETARG
jgi:NAD(P)-dependent dehydrogenase (short-subunit alcohol dehydrogenase family)